MRTSRSCPGRCPALRWHGGGGGEVAAASSGSSSLLTSQKLWELCLGLLPGDRLEQAGNLSPCAPCCQPFHCWLPVNSVQREFTFCSCNCFPTSWTKQASVGCALKMGTTCLRVSEITSGSWRPFCEMRSFVQLKSRIWPICWKLYWENCKGTQRKLK